MACYPQEYRQLSIFCHILKNRRFHSEQISSGAVYLYINLQTNVNSIIAPNYKKHHPEKQDCGITNVPVFS
ncbi:hypothetical protein TH53_11445 [Pedobacter lusitanus]|uniref:Uncharacterized protein n=1 Tax=Pedobacter lusitanus TaxID=1503925 RepID=A0A0D0F613_9SPHI|nr:hypothetical protein TH53_11445 [Pedobacter lusitanus]